MTEPTKRPFRARWAVTAFVVIALVVCSVFMVMQLRDPQDEADSGTPITTPVAGGRATVNP